MKFPGAILMGAHSRLLPPDIPFRFFAVAVAVHVGVWVMLTVSADQVAVFRGGPGGVLTAVHLLTLGVLAMVVMGASYQILPVASGQPWPAVWPCRLSYWLYLVGLILLFTGMYQGDQALMLGGGGLAAAAFLIFIVLVVTILARIEILTLLRVHVGGALVSLMALVVLGLLLMFDYGSGVFADRSSVGLIHMMLAVFGFMGLLTFGYSYILVPMFALAAAPRVRSGLISFAFIVAGLGLAVAGALKANDVLLTAAVVPALAAAALHMGVLVQLMRQGMKKNLGLSFVLVRTAWVLLLVALVVGGLTASGVLDDRGLVLFGFISLFGWLLTFLLGILQRIIPFLAAMNTSAGGVPPRLSELASEKPLRIHAFFHFLALAAITFGIIFDDDGIILFGGICGTVGALSFAWFAIEVFQHMKNGRTN